jgi:DNA-binding response OmpR family regulator
MKKKRILVVDDEVSFTRLLKLNLEQTNDYEVRVETWAEDALPAAREFRPDLILLDVVMPRMNGGDVAARFQADASLKTTPIVFLSAAVAKKWVQEHDGVVGGFPFIAKPASVEEVIDAIEEHLTRRLPENGSCSQVNSLSQPRAECEPRQLASLHQSTPAGALLRSTGPPILETKLC